MASTSSFIGCLGMAPPPTAKPGTRKFRKALKLSDLLLFKEAAHRIAGLRAQSHPILDALGVEFDLRRLLQRIVGPHRFLHAAITRPGPLNDHHAVKGLLFLANPCQPNR